MAITIQQLQDRYTKANAELDSYGINISDKLANGTATANQVRKFNLMSAWISFISSRLTAPIVMQASAPSSIILNIPSYVEADTTRDITMGIENSYGRYIPIISIINYNVGITPDPDIYYTYDLFKTNVNPLASYIDEQGINRGDFSFSFSNSSPTTFTLNFPQTSDFNGQKLSCSTNINAGDYTTYLASLPSLSKGVNEYKLGQSLSSEVMLNYNKALEEIAIELNISY